MIAYEQQLDFAKVFGESLLYGANTVLMIAVAHIQLTSRHLLPSHRVLLIVADVMFLLATAHLWLLLYECFTGTIPPRVLQAAVAIGQCQLCLGDVVLIWRVWVVWNRSLRIIILPVLVLVAGFVVGLFYAASATSYSAMSYILPMPTSVLAVLNTALCTALIAGRLAYLDYIINGHLVFRSGRVHTYRGVILSIIESGAVLTIANIINLTLERLHHPGFHVMVNISVPLTSLAPTAIIVLSHLNFVLGDTANETATVRFATQLEDSAFFTAAGVHERAVTSFTDDLRTMHGYETTTAVRSGAPGIEKQLANSCKSLASDDIDDTAFRAR